MRIFGWQSFGSSYQSTYDSVLINTLPSPAGLQKIDSFAPRGRVASPRCLLTVHYGAQAIRVTLLIEEESYSQHRVRIIGQYQGKTSWVPPGGVRVSSHRRPLCQMLIKEGLKMGTEENWQSPEILSDGLGCGILKYFNAVGLNWSGAGWQMGLISWEGFHRTNRDIWPGLFLPLFKQWVRLGKIPLFPLSRFCTFNVTIPWLGTLGEGWIAHLCVVKESKGITDPPLLVKETLKGKTTSLSQNNKLWLSYWM